MVAPVRTSVGISFIMHTWCVCTPRVHDNTEATSEPTVSKFQPWKIGSLVASISSIQSIP